MFVRCLPIVAVCCLALAGCAAAPYSVVAPRAVTRDAPAAGTTAASPLPAVLPGLGPDTLARVPADADQVLVVTGTGVRATTATAVLFQRSVDGWAAGPSWPAHAGDTGWTARHTNDDLSTPIGVFTLTDAGGLLADPGSKLPYHQGPGFTSHGIGFDGESLAHAFDYVIAINYNRVPGRNPLDWTMPEGQRRGGHIWLHVDHGGPTHGCVSLPAPDLVTLLRTLDPARHPVIVMGDRASLSR
jgi:L,D-peptidoglycan transpeptidase YkuD (ErfK/YbiS/YcfS/YnhG family)